MNSLNNINNNENITLNLFIKIITIIFENPKNYMIYNKYHL